jgi:hypothetical protein
MARKTRKPLSQEVRFATKAFYSRPPNAEEYRCFIPFVDHVEACTTCIDGIRTQVNTICCTGFHLGKKILVHVYQEGGELYSSFDWDVNNETVRLELDNTISDVRRLAELPEIKVMYNIPSYTFEGRHGMAG